MGFRVNVKVARRLAVRLESLAIHRPSHLPRGAYWMPKYFTVEEANRTLPLVRRIVGDIMSTHANLLKRAEEYRVLKSGSEANAVRRRELEQELRQLTDTVNAFVDELADIGAQFKGFDGGLVDFFSILDGRPVFLCWKMGEGSIEWYHELDAGYRGRQRLPAHLSQHEA
jgi:hypothetical protein